MHGQQNVKKEKNCKYIQFFETLSTRRTPWTQSQNNPNCSFRLMKTFLIDDDEPRKLCHDWIVNRIVQNKQYVIFFYIYSR